MAVQVDSVFISIVMVIIIVVIVLKWQDIIGVTGTALLFQEIIIRQPWRLAVLLLITMD